METRAPYGQQAKREDAFSNVLTGMNTALDKVKATGIDFNYTRPVGALLEVLYESDGLARAVVDRPAEAMTRAWIEIEGKGLEKVLGLLEEVNAKKGVTDMVRWARLFGGAIAVIGLDDGGELADPVNEKNIKGVLYVRAFDRWQVNIMPSYIDDDPASRNFGKPVLYEVSPHGGGAPFTVHYSRVMRMDGDPLPDRAAATNNYWGASLLWAAYESIRDIAVAYHAAAHLIHEFTVMQVGIEGLNDLLQTDEGEKTLYKRLLNLDMSVGYGKKLLTDAKETLVRHHASVAGMPELLDKIAERLSSVTGIPITVLMGRSPAGMNATGESDMENYHATISADQEDKLRPELEKLVRYAILATVGTEPNDWHFSFAELWQPSEKEKAEVRKIEVETIDKLVMMGVLTPEQAASELGYVASE